MQRLLFTHVIFSSSPFIPAGKPSVVVDAVFHASLQERCGIDPEFKMFLIRARYLSIISTLSYDG